jgi:hypothetical protein
MEVEGTAHIGSQDPHPEPLGQSGKGFLPAASSFHGLAEARSDEDESPDTLFSTGLDDLLDLTLRDGQNGQIHPLRQRADVRMGIQSI